MSARSRSVPPGNRSNFVVSSKSASVARPSSLRCNAEQHLLDGSHHLRIETVPNTDHVSRHGLRRVKYP